MIHGWTLTHDVSIHSGRELWGREALCAGLRPQRLDDRRLARGIQLGGKGFG
jgi:hypothetical protein